MQWIKLFQKKKKICNDDYYVSHLTQIVEITLYILILNEMSETLEVGGNYNDYIGKCKWWLFSSKMSTLT